MSAGGTSYMGMSLELAPGDVDDRAWFAYLAKGEFRLQACTSCALLRYPPSSMCPWCQCTEAAWEAVNAVGTVHSYTIVRHAIQPAFKAHLPYAVLLVELDRQRGRPGPEEGLRVLGNLVGPDGAMADERAVTQLRIGDRMRLVINPLNEEFGIGHWTPVSC
jgi:hypothetical protein